jgi:dihydroorotate dehydrogenase electron transfer subunit
MMAAASCPGPGSQHVTVPLLRRESIGNAYHVLTFDASGGAAARPGQFAMVRGADWGHAPLLPRPMSYLTGGDTPSILVKLYGEGTRRMAHAESGDLFNLLGPLGNGWREPDPLRRPVLVAGGVGVAPLLFLARTLVVAGKSPLFLYGGRTDRDLPLCDELMDLCELELATEDGTRGIRGQVTSLLERRVAPDKEVFTCGPDRMMAKVASICARANAPCEVSLEAPMACGYGVCLGCSVPKRRGGYLYACSEGPCVDARVIDWSEMDASGGASSQTERKSG